MAVIIGFPPDGQARCEDFSLSYGSLFLFLFACAAISIAHCACDLRCLFVRVQASDIVAPLARCMRSFVFVLVRLCTSVRCVRLRVCVRLCECECVLDGAVCALSTLTSCNEIICMSRMERRTGRFDNVIVFDSVFLATFTHYNLRITL